MKVAFCPRQDLNSCLGPRVLRRPVQSVNIDLLESANQSVVLRVPNNEIVFFLSTQPVDSHSAHIYPARQPQTVCCHRSYPTRRWPVLVIDCGSALTFTAADASGRLAGGAILPGVRLQLAVLGSRTAQLPSDVVLPDELPVRQVLGCFLLHAHVTFVFVYFVVTHCRGKTPFWVLQTPSKHSKEPLYCQNVSDVPSGTDHTRLKDAQVGQRFPKSSVPVSSLPMKKYRRPESYCSTVDPTSSQNTLHRNPREYT